MGKKFDSKSIQAKLDGLYKGVDLTSKNQDDKEILRSEKAGLSTKIRWESMTEEEKEDLKNKQIGSRDYHTWYEKNREKNSSEEMSKKLSEAQLKRYSDPDKKNKHQAGIAAFYADPENRQLDSERKSLRCKGKKYPKEFGEKISKSKNKKIHVPWGIFESRKLATQYAIDNNISDPARKIGKGLKSNPQDYYYL